MTDPVWCVMPVLAGPEMTEAAVADLLAQSVPTRILIVNQGVEEPFRRRLERLAEEYPDRIFCWSHNPPLPSLSATWNRALEFCWQTGGTEAFVVNNDVRLHSETVRFLSLARQQTEAFFVTCVGVGTEVETLGWSMPLDNLAISRGGPDFSCYLISKEGHQRYPFDEMFTPAVCEDCDLHRQYMLGGDGDRIFSINLPYLHLASQTLKQVSPEKRAALERGIAQGSRKHYLSKWGGPVNQERYTIPFNPASAQDGVTNPDLQRMTAGGGAVRVPLGDGSDTAIPS